MKDAGKDNMSQCTQKRREEAGSGQVGYVGLEIPTSLCDELVEERRGEKVWEHQSITLLSLSHTREGAYPGGGSRGVFDAGTADLGNDLPVHAPQ